MEEIRKLLQGNLVNKRNQAVPEIPGNLVLGIYFSASWCPPCRQFTPMLRRYYEEANKWGKRLEIVFVSSDQSESEFSNYFQQHHGEWLAIRFQLNQLRERLAVDLRVRGIPAFFIEGQEARSAVSGGDFSLIDRFARTEIAMDADTRDLLVKIGDNIVRNFIEEKYKTLKKSSEKLQTAVLSKPQGTQHLLELGFRDEGQIYRFSGSMDALIGKLNRLKAATVAPVAKEPRSEKVLDICTWNGKTELTVVLEDFEVFKALVESVIDSSDPLLVAETSNGTLVLENTEDLLALEISSRESARVRVFCLKFSDERNFHSDADAQENNHCLIARLRDISTPEISRFVDVLSVILQYEVPSIQRKALEQVPMAKLFPESGDKFEVNFITAVVRWFKADFFNWIDQPRCTACNGTTQISGTAAPTGHERTVGMASSVEVYACTVCGLSTRFPRYNNPEILLKTRTGRCGEFANVFGLICRALGFDTRKVFPVDGDHVWVEVYLQTLGRWIHVDPCEAAVDQPLLYEGGWGRQYSRVVGVSRRECIDVTWRHAVDLNSKPSFDPRGLELIDQTAMAFYLQTRSRDPEKLKAWLDERRALENQQVSRPMKPSESQGRTTGSFEWRANRGELGNDRKSLILKKQKELVEAGMDPVEAAIEALKLV